MRQLWRIYGFWRSWAVSWHLFLVTVRMRPVPIPGAFDYFIKLRKLRLPAKDIPGFSRVADELRWIAGTAGRGLGPHLAAGNAARRVNYLFCRIAASVSLGY